MAGSPVPPICAPASRISSARRAAAPGGAMRPGCGPFRAGLPPADVVRLPTGSEAPEANLPTVLCFGSPPALRTASWQMRFTRPSAGAALARALASGWVAAGSVRVAPHADRSAPPPSGQGPAGPRIRPGRPTLRKGQASRTPPASPNDPGDRPSRRGRGKGSVQAATRGGDKICGAGLVWADNRPSASRRCKRKAAVPATTRLSGSGRGLPPLKWSSLKYGF